MALYYVKQNYRLTNPGVVVGLLVQVLDRFKLFFF